MPGNTGIYAIEHAASGKLYIGSAVNFGNRWRGHLCLLKKGKHHSVHLQSAWNKYGASAFQFKKLLVCAKESLIFYEQRCVDGFKSANRLFGFNASVVVDSRLGMKHTDAAREKIKAKRALQVFSEETRALLSVVRTGRKMPEWFPEFARKLHTGMRHTDAAKAKIGAAGKGRVVSHETIAKKPGTKLTPEQVSELRAAYAKGGITQAALGCKYGIDQSNVSVILSGKRWSTVK